MTYCQNVCFSKRDFPVLYFPSHTQRKGIETEGEKVCIATFSQMQSAFVGGRVGGRCVQDRICSARQSITDAPAACLCENVAMQTFSPSVSIPFLWVWEGKYNTDQSLFEESTFSQ